VDLPEQRAGLGQDRARATAVNRKLTHTDGMVELRVFIVRPVIDQNVRNELSVG